MSSWWTRRAAGARLARDRLWDRRPDRRDPEAIRTRDRHRHRSSAAVHRPGFRDLLDPRATFRLGSAVETGLPDDGVDVVVAGFVLNFVPDVGAALAEWRRVLARDGVVGAYVWDYARGMALIRLFWDAAVAVDPGAAALDQGGQAGITDAGLEAAFQGAGFVSVEAGSITIPMVFVDFDDLWLPFLGGTGGAPGYLATLDDVHRDAIREQLRRSSPPNRTARFTSKHAPGRSAPASPAERRSTADPSARDRRWVVTTEQDPEVRLPRSDGCVMRGGHPREDLARCDPGHGPPMCSAVC